MIKQFIPSLKKPSKVVERRIPVSKHGVHRDQFSPLALKVVDRLLDEGHEAYIVGGCIRDVLLGKDPKDFDVATSARPEQVQKLFRRSRIIGRRFKIVHVEEKREIIEVTTFRGDHKSGNSRHATQSSEGMLLRDNVYGSLHEDAIRRDFTCNSLYFDMDSEEIVDFLDGVRDIKQRVLRTIGEPEERFREDPVRMMRALRFQSKLGLKLDTESFKQLKQNIGMIREVSSARLFDEVIKLLMHESSASAFGLMLDTGLMAQLFPASAGAVKSRPMGLKLLNAAMTTTEARLKSGKNASPFYLYAVLLWPAVEQEFQQQLARKQPPARAMQISGDKTIAAQSSLVSIPRRFSQPMREIWEMQNRLPQRNKAQKLLEHQRFRAAYDFLLIREQAGEDFAGLGDWWTRYQNADPQGRDKMISELPAAKSSRQRQPRKRKPVQKSQ
jgi:poly(A) polymerase